MRTCGFLLHRTCSIDIPWELVRNAESLALLLTYWLRICIFHKMSSDSYTHQCLKSTVLYSTKMAFSSQNELSSLTSGPLHMLFLPLSLATRQVRLIPTHLALVSLPPLGNEYTVSKLTPATCSAQHPVLPLAECLALPMTFNVAPIRL